MSTTFLGIDPGLDGALVAIAGSIVVFHDTPTVTVKVGSKFKRQIDPHGCARLLRQYCKDDLLMVTIEKVTPMPSFKGKEEGEEPSSMGVTSAFSFGWGLGVWIGVCAGLNLPFQLVAPRSWKSRLMADMSKEKDASRVKAMQLYPHISGDLARKKDHNRADALLLARYGQMVHLPGSIQPPQPATLFG
jgi:crossover junction endodeoxyribonuclease RuvC